MASPQLADGFTKIANEIFEHLCGFRIPGEVRQVVDTVIRKTYGFNKKEDIISNSQFVEMTGMKKGNVSRSLSKAITHNLVIRSDNGLALQKDWEKWIPFEPVIKSDNTPKVIKAATKVIRSDNDLLSEVMDTKESKYTLQKKYSIPVILEPLSPPLKEVFEKYIEMRRANKHPLTPYAVHLELLKLRKLASSEDDQIKIVQQSITRSWRGLFPIKDNFDKKDNALPVMCSGTIREATERELHG